MNGIISLCTSITDISEPAVPDDINFYNADAVDIQNFGL
jgi:hypothetical protein